LKKCRNSEGWTIVCGDRVHRKQDGRTAANDCR
jgi:hypothetical protein